MRSALIALQAVLLRDGEPKLAAAQALLAGVTWLVYSA